MKYYYRTFITAAIMLNRVAEHMLTGSITRLQLKGHADATGSSDYNLALSQRRANAAREYLLEKGISPDRMTQRAPGDLDPAKTGHSREALAYNRRVELLLITGNRMIVENLYQDLQP